MKTERHCFPADTDPAKRSFFAIIVGLLTVFLISTAAAQIGGLDSSFNAGAILNGSNNGIVRASASMTGGQHLIAGEFTSVGGVARGNLAKLNTNGSLDQTFASGSGANGPIHAMAVDSNGRILIGGDFTMFDGVARNRIARLTSVGALDTNFDLGSGCNAAVYCIELAGSSIYIGGDFTTYNGAARGRLASLDGSGWLNGVTFNGGANATVRALRAPGSFSSVLYVGGDFTTAGGATRGYFAEFSASSGSISGSNLLLNGPVRAIGLVSSNFSSSASLILGGDFTAVGSASRGRLAMFTSGSGRPLALDGSFNFSLDGPCQRIVVENPTSGSNPIRIFTGGDFTAVNGLFRSRLALFTLIPSNSSFNPSYWNLNVSYGETGLDGPVYTVGRDVEGRPLLGGAFNGSASITRNGFLRLTGDAGDMPPASPASILAVTLSDTQIYVSWSSTSLTSAYTLEASPDGATNWTQIYTGPATNFTEAGLSTGSPRFYRARSSNYNGSSGFAEATATTNPAAWAGAGSLQNSLPPGSINGAVSAMMRQPDGKIVIAGSFTVVLGAARKYIARLFPDLTLDTSFNPGVGADSSISQIQLAPDGRIYIFGDFSTISGWPRDNIARLTSSGAVDVTFDTGAEWTFSDGIRVQADGRLIVFGGFDGFFGAPRSNIARLELDGSVDASFNCFPSQDVDALAIQGSGKMLLAGFFSSINGISTDYYARVDTNGTVDGGFAGTTTSVNISTLTPLPTGKYYATGSFTSLSGVSRKYLARLNENGTVDATFDPGGSAATSNPLVFQQPDGKVIVTGSFTSFANTPRWKTARLNADGTLDPTFNVEAGAGSGTVNAVLPLPDGSMLVGGNFTRFGASARGHLVHLKGDGSPTTPSVPQNLAGTPLSASSILLSWDQLSDEYSWKVERSPAGVGAWQQIAEPGWDVTSIIDIRLSINTAYDYRIRAWNSSGDSPFSNISTVRTMSAFDQWKLDLDIPVTAGDSFDGEGDGVGLFLEYAFGLDPDVVETGGMPVAELFDSFLTMSYLRLRPELDYSVEASADLVNWSDSAVNQGTGRYPTAWTPIGNEPRLFLRLRVSR
jgi:uncharacterized delta-60 repeat protein